MEYQKWQLEKDWNFAQELLDRFGLKNFRITYHPSTVPWLFWHKHLNDHLIKSEFDKIQYYNRELSFNYNANDEEQFEKWMPIMAKLYGWISCDNEMTKKDYTYIFSSFCGSGYITEKFANWIEQIKL